MYLLSKADPHGRAHRQPPAGIGAFRQAQGVKRRQRPKPKADRVGRNLHAEVHQYGGEKHHERGEDLGESSSPQLLGEQARNVNGRGGKERGDGAQEHKRVAEHLRSGSEKRRHRRLVNVAPPRVLPTNNEIEFIAEKSIVRVAHEVQPKRREGGNQRNSQAAVRQHICAPGHERRPTIEQYDSVPSRVPRILADRAALRED